MSDTQSARTNSANAELPQANPADILPPASNVSTQSGPPRSLTLVYPVGSDPLQYRRALVPFPETYEGAIEAAVRVLGVYMNNPNRDEIVLRCLAKSVVNDMKTECWVWADIEPAHWKATLADRPAEVGVFLPVPAAQETFLLGKVYLTVGTWNGYKTEWSKINFRSQYDSDIIDRPRSFSEAVSIVQKSKWALVDVPGEDMSFCEIQNEILSAWTAFPPQAYVDEKVWQAMVPLPGGILGVFSRKRNW